VAGFISRVKIQKTIAVSAIVLGFGAGSYGLAQMTGDDALDGSPYDAMARPTDATSQNELANLVAPVALYPDGLLGQVLVASTYPDEVVEAQWWLEANGNLSGAQLVAAARQQNWDPSVQLLVAFPDVVALLNQDIRWTTELGNAFLQQQADVMNAVQDLRAQARGSGQLANTAQFSVNAEVRGDRSAIEIEPTDPQRMFVPNYDPSAVWGPPAEGAYPSLPYAEGAGLGSLVGTVANLAGFLPTFAGFLGPNSWGWVLNWAAQALFVNNSFFNDFGFHNNNGGFGGTSQWAHDGNRRFGGRFGNDSVAGWQGRGGMGSAGRGWRNFGEGGRFGDRDSYGRYRTASSRGGDPRPVRGGDWRRFNGDARTGSAGQFGRTSRSSQYSRSAESGGQRDYRNGRDSYRASSAYNRGGSYGGSRSFDSSRRGDEFARTGRARREPSRVSTRSWKNERGKEPHFSGRGSSRRGYEASSKHGSSSHSYKAPKYKAPKYKAPKYKAPHYAKSHGGGGHSFKDHSSKKHHG
jgi:Protein of unknown function (DUF3300)